MLMKDPKKMVASIIMKKMGKPEEQSEEAPKSENEAEADNSIGHKSAAEEIMKAIESKDVSMLMDSLKSFIELCQYEQPEEPSEPEQY